MRTRILLLLAVVLGFALVAWPSSSPDSLVRPARAGASCDLDGDGYVSVDCGGNDCDDFNAWINPGATEYCNDGVDNDCDGDVDMSQRQAECAARGWFWLPEDCLCSAATPVVVDVMGDGCYMTDAQGGVDFDINNDGLTERLAWTLPAADDSFLALDRDGDGSIEGGGELFGNFTAQPRPPAGEERNGFLALAEFDRPEQGGNGDGLLDARDAVFSRLRLWRDADHDGASGAGELHTLGGVGLKSISLDYKESKRTDEHGNLFRYRAKVRGTRDTQLGRWAWDVYLVSGR